MDVQADIFEFLGSPAAHGGQSVSRIDTHAACVFLAGDRAFKVKRAVRFPFLDYSTLEKRKRACESEIAVNRNFAPEIYLGVAAITRERGGALAIAGRGEPVEWAVEMRRFDEEATLDRLAGKNRIDAAMADALGRAVAAAHATAPKADAGAWIAALSDYARQNEAELSQRPDIFDTEQIARLGHMTRECLKKTGPLLRLRGEQGFVRRGHGDLHLGNIALIGGKPVLFDAIEFDPLVASGDVLYDLAFLLMDLAERGLDCAANTVFNRYLAQTRNESDFDALAALPLFLSLRAAIRAKVTAARLAHAASARAPAIAQSAKTYFECALRFIEPQAPSLTAIGGLSGTGKSVLARALACGIPPVPGAVLLRSDVERKAMFGAAETQKLPPSAYEQDTTAKIYASLAAKAARILRAGHSAVADAVFARPQERELFARLAQDAGVAFHGLFLTADLQTRIARVGARTADASDADAAVVQRQESYDLGALEWRLIDASGTPDDTFARAKQVLR